MIPVTDGTLLVGLGHKARQGKDTVGEMVERVLNSLGISTKRYSYAAALYGFCRAYHGMTEKDPVLLQRVGVAEREKDSEVWVSKCFERIALEGPQVAIITDTRFLNEADIIRERGGLVAKVTRVQADGTNFVDPSRPADHVSEIALDHYTFDMTIRNHGLLDLPSRVLFFASQIANHLR